MNNQTPGYLYGLLFPPNRHYKTHMYSEIRQIFCRKKTFSNSILPQTVREWKKLGTSIFQAPSYSVFRKALLGFIRPTANSTFGINDIYGLKLLTCLRVGFSHFREHKFKHNFQDTLNPLWIVSLKQKTLMRCQNFSNQQNVLFDDLNSINSKILKMSENEIVQVSLFGNKSFSKDLNFRIITSSILFIKDSKRFDESLSLWEKPFWYIFTTWIKITKYFFHPLYQCFM